jgi:glycerol-3-phosphate dehydrogenase
MPGAPSAAPTDQVALAGGDIGDFEAFRTSARRAVAAQIGSRTLDAWVRNYGTEFRALAALAESPAQAERLGDTDAVLAEVTHAVREEMALKLEDVILRRTDLGSGSHPGAIAIGRAADAMGAELGWSEARRRAEIGDTERVLGRHRAAVPASQGTGGSR